MNTFILDRRTSGTTGTDTAGKVSQTNVVPEDLICTDQEVLSLKDGIPTATGFHVYEQDGITFDYSKDPGFRKPYMISFSDGTEARAKQLLLLMTGYSGHFEQFPNSPESWKWVEDPKVQVPVQTADPNALQEKLDQAAENALSMEQKINAIYDKVVLGK